MFSKINCLTRKKSVWSRGKSEARNSRSEATESTYDDEPTYHGGDHDEATSVGFSGNGESPLHSIMSHRPSLELVNLLINTLQNEDRFDCLPEETIDVQGRTPLHLAAAEGCDISVIQRLLIRNKSVQMMDSLGRYPLHYACANARGLPSIHRSGSSVYSPQQAAQNMIEVITTLVWAYPKAASFPDQDGCTPLDLAKQENAGFKILQILETNSYKAQKQVLIKDKNGIRSVNQQAFEKNLSQSQHSWKKIQQHATSSHSRNSFAQRAAPTDSLDQPKQFTSNNTSLRTAPKDVTLSRSDFSRSSSHLQRSYRHFDTNNLPRSRTQQFVQSFTPYQSQKSSHSNYSGDCKSVKTVRARNSMSWAPPDRKSFQSGKCGSSVETHDLTDSQGTPSSCSEDVNGRRFREDFETVMNVIQDRVILPTCFEQTSLENSNLKPRQMNDDYEFDPWNELSSMYVRASDASSADSRDIVLVNQLLPTIMVKHGEDDDDCSSIGVFSANMHFFLDQTREQFGKKKRHGPDYERMEI